MKIINKRLNTKEFEEYVSKKDFGSIPPNFIVLHHTWKPTKKDWKGQSSIDGLKKYYEAKGWNAGPHIFVADDGIWLFTDMYEVGIHAGTGNGDLKNGYSIGIEVVGDYDNEVWEGNTKENVVSVLKILMKKLNIENKDIHFHNEYSSKTCPGKMITKEYVFNLIDEIETTDMKESSILSKIVSILGFDFGDKVNEKESKKLIDEISSLKSENKKLKEELETYDQRIVNAMVEKDNMWRSKIKDTLSKLTGE